MAPISFSTIFCSIIPSHKIAAWLLDNIDNVLDHLGMTRNDTAEEVIYFIVIFATSVLIGWLIRHFILFVTQKVVALRHTEIARELLQQRVLTRCSHVIPPLVFLGLIPFAFDNDTKMLTVIMRLGGAYLTLMFAIGINAVLAFVFNHFNEHENTKNLPLRGTLNIGKGIVWIVSAIIIVSILIHRSPAVLLTGLGAFAAALMLIFKDSILGFVAGIQMSQNDMVRVGDWIVVHNTDANGTVLDVSLTTVKVQNWDNTITMVPPYTLVSTSFTNYRGMYDSGVRRIYFTLIIDIATVLPLTPERLAAIEERMPDIADYVNALKAKGETSVDEGGHTAKNGTIQTNLGLFRAWTGLYLINDPEISKEHMIMVRLLDSNEYGIPMQLYCFTTTTDWAKYQSIQSRVVEYITANAPKFGINIYARNVIEMQHGPTARLAPTPIEVAKAEQKEAAKAAQRDTKVQTVASASTQPTKKTDISSEGTMA